MDGINNNGKTIPLITPHSEIAVCLSIPHVISTAGKINAVNDEVNEFAVRIKVMGTLADISGFSSSFGFISFPPFATKTAEEVVKENK